MMGSHPTWCLVVAFSVLCSGTRVPPRQIVYQIRPAPLSSYTSQDGTYLLDSGVTEFQFPTFGLKTQPATKTVKIFPTSIVSSPPASSLNDSGDFDSSSSSSSSSSPSEESSVSATREEITEVPRFGTSQMNQAQVAQQFLQLQPEQIQQIFQQFQPQQVQQIELQQQQQPTVEQIVPQQTQNVDIGPTYEFRSDESNVEGEDIKAAQSEVITEDKLQPAYSERREKRKKKDPPGDASYAFGYETEEAARHEVADADGNVKGWYTYVDDEGVVRKIIYTAGAGKGFVVLGKEKVRGPKNPPQSQSRRYNGNNKGSSSNIRSDYLGFAADTSTLNTVKQQKPQTTPASFTNYVSFNSWSDLAKAGTSNPPVPTTIIATSQPAPRTKKPVFIVKIRRPVTKEQFHNTKPFIDPEPLPVPITTKSRTRRRGTLTLSDVVPPSLRKSRIKQYQTPPIYYADDDDESGDDETSNSSQASSSSSSSGDYDNSENESREPIRSSSSNNNGGGGGGGGGGELAVKGDPDSSYVFGYETEHSNRLEKADPYGNVRGSYSYIGSSINQLLSRQHSPYSSSGSHHHHRQHVVDEPYNMRKKRPILLRRSIIPQRKSKKRSLKSLVDPEGVKRTVHYVAGGNTGFKVIHASPSISRGVRLEAPPGYVVKRVPSLRTSESRFPIPITVPQPSAIVYHIHPDSGWKPWEPTLRKKKIKIHRKKLSKALLESARRDGIVLLQTHPDPNTPVAHHNTNKPIQSGSSSTSEGIIASAPIPMSNNGNVNFATTLGVSAGNPATGAYFKEKITTAGSGTVTATEAKLPPPPVPSRRRHAPQRGYTAEHHLVQIDDDSKEHVAASAYVNSHNNNKHSKPHSSSSSSSQSSQSQSKSMQQQQQQSLSQNGGVHDREPLLYSPTFESMRDTRMPIPNPIQLQPTQVAIKNRGAPTQTVTGAPGLDASSSNHHAVAFSSDGKLQVDVPTVIIETIEANKSPSSSSSSSLQMQQTQEHQQQQKNKDENRNVAHHKNHHKLPEAATSSTTGQQQSGSNINFIQGSTPISPSSSPQATYQPSSISAPTPPVTSSSSSSSIPQQQQQLHTHQQVISSVHQQPQQQQAPPPSQSRSRRRHHRSKSGGTNPTSPSNSGSSSSASSSSSSNAIHSGVSKVVETTTMMSSSKRLINRLAASDRDETLSAQQ